MNRRCSATGYVRWTNRFRDTRNRVSKKRQKLWDERPRLELDTSGASCRRLLSLRGRLLERKELLRAEGFVMDLRRSLDKILQVRSAEGSVRHAINFAVQ